MSRIAVLRGMIISLSVLSISPHAAQTPDQTQSQLAHLNDKIGTLKQKLSGVQQQQTQEQ